MLCKYFGKVEGAAGFVWYRINILLKYWVLYIDISLKYQYCTYPELLGSIIYITAKTTWLKWQVKVTPVSGFIKKVIKEIQNMIIINQFPSQPSSFKELAETLVY